MLTPAQFWPYYDHCLAYREDIVENSFHDYNGDEWMDALVLEGILLLIHPRAGSSYLGAYEAQEKYDLGAQLEKRFRREQASAQHGLPTHFDPRGEWDYWIAPNGPCVARRAWDYDGRGSLRLSLLVANSPSADIPHCGAGECRGVRDD